MPFNNGSKSEGENNAGGKDEDNASGKGKDDAGGKDKNNVGRKSEDNNGRESENNINRNGKILNAKLKIGDTDEKSNLSKIAAGKLAFGCIANPLINTSASSIVTPNHLTIPLVVSLVPSISGFFALSSITSGFLTPSYSAPSLFVHFVPDLPTILYLDSSVIPLIGLDAFLYALSLTFLIYGGIIKFLAEVIAKFFGNNSSVITHIFYDGYTSEQALGIFFEVRVVNLFLVVIAIFDT